MLLLTGPTAAGKNTVGLQLVKQQSRCAVVDFDAVRAMFVQPHHAPWQGEGKAQQLLGVQHVCQLARGFSNAGWKVVLQNKIGTLSADNLKKLEQAITNYLSIDLEEIIV